MGKQVLVGPGGNILERHALVGTGFLGQAQHLFGDDVAHDLVGTARQAYPGENNTCSWKWACSGLSDLILDDAGRAEHLAGKVGNLLVHHRAHQFAHGGFSAGDAALGHRGDHALVGRLQARILAVPGGQALAHRRVVGDGLAIEFQGFHQIQELRESPWAECR